MIALSITSGFSFPWASRRSQFVIDKHYTLKCEMWALIIVEVLSKSTRYYDWTDKFKYYRSIPEFQEYILIDQYQFYAAQYFKQGDGQWLFKDYEGAETILKLASGDWSVSFQDLYARVDFNLDEE